LERPEMDILIEECCGQPDEDGFIPYEGWILIAKSLTVKFLEKFTCMSTFD
jgi:hypothetical protein